MEILVVVTTESSKANALRMAKLLIQNKFAACVSIKQIFSIYKWDDDCLLYTSPSPRDDVISRMPSSA